MKNKNLAISAAISAAILGLSATGALAHLEPKKGEDMEKCYGVVKAGQNDCGNASKTHSCMGHAEIDGDGGEWISLPEGLCEKLVGGSLEPYEGTEAPASEEDKG